MFRFNRLPLILISLVAAYILVAHSIVTGLLTSDNPLPPQKLFSWERRDLWIAVIALVPVSVWLTYWLASKSSDKSQSETKEKKCRKRVLEQVSDQIDNFAPPPSLKEKIPLRWKKRPDLEIASTNNAESKDYSETLLPPDIDEVEHFLKNLETGGTLLILGDRGAGKSTTFQELAHTLLNRAKTNPDAEMPIRLYLPDWERYCKIAKSRSSPTIFQDWVIAALTQPPYKIDQEIITPWLDSGELTLLLDGLDELSNQAWCQKCVEEINQFRQKNSLTSIIICCQSQAYTELRSPLKVEHAFCIRPLELEHIEDFLNQPGEDFSKIRTVYQAMPQKFHTPLDLNVLYLACQELPLKDVSSLLQGEGWYSRFWEQYIQRMFQQRRASSRYTKENVEKWLCWLAQKMQVKSQYFWIEQLQPSWLNNRLQKILYWSLCKILNSCKIFLLCICFLGELFLSMMITIGIVMKPVYNNLTVMVTRLYGDPSYERIYEFLIRIYPPNPIITKEVFLLFAIILISGIAFFLIIEFIYLIYLAMETPEEKVRPVETWKFLVPEETRRHYLGVIFLAVVFSSPFLWAFWQVPQLDATLVPGKVLLIPGSAIVLSIIASGIFFLCMMLLMDLFPNSIKINEFQPSRRSIRPNQGIFNSVNNSIQIGLLFSCFGIILLGLGGWFLWGFNHGIGIGILGVLFFGIENSLEHGSATFIPHISLRLILHFSNLTPWNYRSFLDYAAKLGFLEKKCGAYAFIDPSLQEYFAEMNANGRMEQQ
jgi:hypothetical protein